MKKLITTMATLMLSISFVSVTMAAGATKTAAKTKTTAPGKPTGSYNITVTAPQLKNDTIFLAYYMNGKTFVRDTTVVDAKGKGAFTDKKPLDQGVYIVYVNSGKYFDMLVGKDQQINIVIDTVRINESKITGAQETVDFQSYFAFLGEMNRERNDVMEKYRLHMIDSAVVNKDINEMTVKVEARQKSVMEAHKNDFLGDYVKGTIPVETPMMTELPDSVRNNARYQYFKHHFFDNINLSDPRFLRTPYFPSMVDNYMSRHILQDPDTLAATAIELIEKSRGDSITFQVMCSKMINYGISSKMMGMERLWYLLAEKYYFSGQATWADTAWVSTLRKEAKKIRYNMVGMNARELAMRDSANNSVKLSSLKQECVLVYFFEPSCGHCRKTTPILHDSVYAKWKNKGFEVFACYTQTDRKEWMDFVHEHHLEDWVNVWDPERESWFWDSYDTSATPGIYLLDKDRKIIAKKIDMETLDMILEEELVKRKQPKK